MSKEGRRLSCSECGYTLPGHGEMCSRFVAPIMTAIPPEDGALIRWVVIDRESIEQIPVMLVKKDVPIEVFIKKNCKGLVAIIVTSDKRQTPLPFSPKS